MKKNGLPLDGNNKEENRDANADNNTKKLPYRVISAVCIAVLLFSVLALAYLGAKKLGIIDGISWTLSESGVLVISGSGEIKDFDPKDLDEWHELPTGQSVTEIIIKDGITSVGDYAFYKCSKVTKVTLPDSLRDIGAFAFQDCTGISELSIPDGVTEIGKGAFYGCNSLFDIELSKTLASVGYDAFFNTGVYNKTSNWEAGALYISGCLVKVKKNQSGSFNVKADTLYIADGAFADCEKLTGVNVSEGTLAIGADAFANCKTLYSVSLPSTLAYVGGNAFGGCTRLTDLYYGGELEDWLSVDFIDVYSNPLIYTGGMMNKSFLDGDVTVPDGISTVHSGAFANCKGLSSVTLSDSVALICDDAFYGCTGLATFSVTDGNTAYKAVDGVLFNADLSELLLYPVGSTAAEYTVPDGVVSIGVGAFSGASTLEKVVLPQSLERINENAFFDMPSLSSVNLHEGIKYLCDGAFDGSDGVAEALAAFYETYLRAEDDESASAPVDESGDIDTDTKNVLYNYEPTKGETVCTVPDGVECIAAGAFSQCEGIEEIVLPDSLSEIESGAFLNCGTVTKITLSGDFSGIDADVFLPLSGVTEAVFAAGLVNFDMAALSRFESLESLEVDDANTEFVQCGNEYFNADKTALLYYVSDDGQTEYTVPAGVTEIGDYVFENQKELRFVTLPSGLLSIGDRAFAGCSALEELYLPDSVVAIGAEAFSDCVALTGVVLPDSVKSVGTRAFFNCKGLARLELPDTFSLAERCRVYADSYFVNEADWSNGGLYIASCLVAVDKNHVGAYEIAEGTTVVADCAFAYCTGITELYVPASVVTIGETAFIGCDALEAIYDAREDSRQ